MIYRCLVILLICFLCSNTAQSQVLLSFGADSNDVVSNIQYDKFGNIYVAANFSNSIKTGKKSNQIVTSFNHSQDIILVKYNAIGKLIWSKKIGGIGKEEVHDFKIDANGFLYLVGCFTKNVSFEAATSEIKLISSGNTDAFLAKISTITGNAEWVNKIGDNGIDDIFAVEIDKTDGVVVAGRFSNSIDVDVSKLQHLLISKSTSSEISTAFIARYSSYDGAYIYGHIIGIANNNNLFQSQASLVSDENSNCFYASTFNEKTDINPEGNAISIENKGKNDVVIIKYDVNGVFQNWVTVGGNGNENCSNKCLTLSKKNELIMAVSIQNDCEIGNKTINNTYHSISETDLLFMKFNNKLTDIKFVKNISDDGMTNCNQILVDDNDDIWLCGYTKKRNVVKSPKPKAKTIATNSNLFNSYFIIKANKEGAIISKKFNNNVKENASIHNVSYNQFSKDLWITGNFTNSFQWQNEVLTSNGKKDFFVLKLRDDFSIWKSQPSDLITEVKENNFVVDVKSNQQSTLLNIKYIVANDKIKLSIIDYKGNLIKKLLDDKQPKGLQQIFFDISFLPTGVYFIRLNDQLKLFER